jgi:prepilin peptidase CpaA
MNTVNVIAIPLVVLIGLMALAALIDLRESRVPNWVSAFVLLSGLGFCIAGYTPLSFLQAGGGLAVGLAGFLPFYAVGGMGAGDVKLMAAGGSFLGPLEALYAVAATLIIGGFGILAYYSYSRVRQHLTGIVGASMRKSRFPYAPCIATGIAAVFIDRYLSTLGTLT